MNKKEEWGKNIMFLIIKNIFYFIWVLWGLLNMFLFLNFMLFFKKIFSLSGILNFFLYFFNGFFFLENTFFIFFYLKDLNKEEK
jgi:hypothetical protein